MQQQEMNSVRLDELRGEPVVDSAGEKIGKVEEIYYDPETRAPEWIGIGTGFLTAKRVLVPVEGAQVTGEGLMVAYSRDHVKDGPDVDENEITYEREAELNAHYGITRSTGPSTGAATDEDQALTRSEEEIEVGTRQVDAGTARLRKWVETEPVSLDVQLRREVATVTRERIDQPVGDHDFAEETVDVPLHAEKPVVQKQTVAKERIGVQKDVRTDTQTVRDEVRKEHVEVEGDVDGSQ
ncbi:MAG: DUF2382 domain-containing protein [Gaiellaceae bacterium]